MSRHSQTEIDALTEYPVLVSIQCVYIRIGYDISVDRNAEFVRLNATL